MSPMWLTSNTPTPPRTARCSHIRLPLHGYSTGMSQPPKLTILAPKRLCSAFSAVFRRLELAGEFPESIPFAQAEIDVSTHPRCRQKSGIPGPTWGNPFYGDFAPSKNALTFGVLSQYKRK